MKTLTGRLTSHLLPVLLLSPATLMAQQSDRISTALPSSKVQLLPQFRPIGGSGNNLVHPSFDVIPGAAELNLAPLNFAAGTQDGLSPGPNPRAVSNVIAGGTGERGQDADSVELKASAWLYVFGQFVDHDIDLESTPPDTAAIDIAVPPGDPVFAAGTHIAMTRDARSRSTNTIINTVAGYLDLSQMYGTTTAIAAGLRNSDGTLKSSDHGRALPVVDGVFVTGDPRVMENPELTVLTILFMREHNFWVATLQKEHPDWSGDELHDMAKAITTAEYQNVIYTEYLPVLLGHGMSPYKGYDPRVNAQVTQEFSTAAFRMGHSEVSDTQEGVDNDGNTVFTESLAQGFFNTPAIDEANGIDPLIRAIGLDNSQATDVYSAAVLRNLLFAGLVGGDVDEVDLIAIDIQRERDVGLGTLNQTRQALGLKPYTSFEQLTDDSQLQTNFAALYGSIDKVDLFMGGLAETHARGADVGATFEAILVDQFEALRTGDRFWWQNQKFDRATAAMIGESTLAKIILRNTDTTRIAANVFVPPTANQHTKPHAPRAPINNHGRRGKPFMLP